METKIYKNLDEDLMNEWKQLWEESSFANYTNSPQWFLSVLESFHYTEYIIIAVYRETKLVAVAALVKEKKFGVSCYTVAPGNFVCGTPFLADLQDQTVLDTLIKELLAAGTVYLENIPEQMIVALRKQTQQMDVAKQALNLYFPIKKDEKGSVIIPKRSRLTNRIRGIEEHFEVKSFDGMSSEGLSIVFTIDNQSSKQNKGYSTFGDPETKIFYTNLAKHYGKELLINVLYFEKKPIAYYIGFLAGTTYYWSQNAYILEYGQYSPGKILLVNLIDFLGSKNITLVNFGSGDYRMKRLLTDEYFSLYYVILSKKKIRRQLLLVLTQLKNDLYERLHSNTTLYAVYRKLKKKV